MFLELPKIDPKEKIPTRSVCLAWPRIFYHCLNIFKVQTLQRSKLQVPGGVRELLSLVGEESWIYDGFYWSNSSKFIYPHLSR